ncbi:uncharacterized protein [Haliotis asinina]|uniref:uncharacterized protein n=1 Tax=Haliotis asinina TaxID=109174 RepID=UPI0035323194
MLLHLLLSLNWQSALILRTQEIEPSFVFTLEEAGIYYVDYDISSTTKEFLLTSLLDVEKVITPHLRMLLLCDVSTTVSVLRLMSGLCGTRSNSSVDFCHISQVLVLGTSSDLPLLSDIEILVENLALLELPKGQGRDVKTRMWTLMFRPAGRAFTTVALSDETDTNLTEVFPNVKFGYNGRQLTVVMQNVSYGYGYEIIDKQRVYGYAFRVLKALAQGMNFSYRIIPPREDEWGKNINGTWTGEFGRLQRKEADLAADILTIHTDRTGISEYILPPVGVNKRMILYKKDTDVDEDHLMVLLRPFQAGVFSIFGGSFILYASFVSTDKYTEVDVALLELPTGQHNILGYGYELVNNTDVYGYPFRILKMQNEFQLAK